MRIDILREFVLLATNLNFTVTAKQCFITQSVLSRHIAALEKELAVMLFIRDNNRVRLTRSGEFFSKKMQTLVCDYDEAIAETYSLEKDVAGTLKIAYLYGASRAFLPIACRDFRAKNESVIPILYSNEVDSLLRGVAQNKYDVGLVANYGNINATWYSTYRIYQDYFTVAVSASHPLAALEVVRLEDIAGQTVSILSKEENSELVNYIEHAFRERNLKLTARDSITSFDSFLIDFDPSCIAIVPSCFKDFAYSNDICFIPLEDDFVKIDICAIWKNSERNNPYIPLFLQSIDTAVAVLAAQGVELP